MCKRKLPSYLIYPCTLHRDNLHHSHDNFVIPLESWVLSTVSPSIVFSELLASLNWAQSSSCRALHGPVWKAPFVPYRARQASEVDSFRPFCSSPYVAPLLTNTHPGALTWRQLQGGWRSWAAVTVFHTEDHAASWNNRQGGSDVSSGLPRSGKSRPGWCVLLICTFWGTALTLE